MNQGNAGDTFSDAVRGAIDRESVGDMRHAFAELPSTEVTRAISARISAQEFMRIEKTALSLRVERVDETGDFEGEIRDYIYEMDEHYHGLLEVPYGVPPHNKKYLDAVPEGELRGDEILRVTIDSMDDEKAIRFVEHIASMPLAKLISPSEVAEWMWSDVRQSTVERLWEVVQDYRTDGATNIVKEAFRNEVNDIMNDLNQKIPGALLR